VKDKPSMIACRTVIGFGAPTRAGTAKAHGEPLGAEEIKGAREKLGWTAEPFVVPEPILSAWREIAARGARAHADWDKRVKASAKGAALTAQMKTELPADFADKMNAYKAELSQTAPKVATRKASEMVLGVVNAATDLTIGGSADLTHSNYTVTKGQKSVTPGDFSGSYMHYGVREHGMAAAMNGIALHGGFIPYGGTFMVFTDYARGAMRLSALMEQRVVYVMTHDSIGLGEDGPTHQPIEHLAMLRATPNTLVFRPADPVETAECWQIALETTDAPSVLALSRQAVPTLRTTHTTENLSAKGGYVLREAEGGKRDVTLIGTGTELELAVKAADMLAKDGIKAAVVSLPCWELFDKQDASYRRSVLGTAPRVAVEAASGMGWERWTGDSGAFIGMKGFGASAPAPQLYEHFGITAEKVAEAARRVMA
jgi:transketolase